MSYFLPFFAAFFCFAFVLAIPVVSDHGRPLLSHCFKNSMSSSVRLNIAFAPIYRVGSYPCRFNLLRAASEETMAFSLLNRNAISPTVNSIYLSIYGSNTQNQGVNGKMSKYRTYLLYNRIVKTQKFYEFLKKFMIGA